MKKLFTIITLTLALLVSNIADAKFSDEYRAKYPKRVKVVTKTQASGKKVTDVTYKLFSHTLNGIPFRIVLTVSDDIIKVCLFSAGTVTDRPEKLSNFAWGDGEKSHDLKPFISYTERQGHHKYVTFLSSNVMGADLKEMKNAVAFSIQGPGGYWKPVLYPSHKHWKEWQEAIDAAEKLMSERWSPQPVVRYSISPYRIPSAGEEILQQPRAGLWH